MWVRLRRRIRIGGSDADRCDNRPGCEAADQLLRRPLSGAVLMDQDLKDFASLIDAADRIVLFTGAGISTESGIPDFRSPGGIWTKQTPIDFSDFIRSQM